MTSNPDPAPAPAPSSIARPQWAWAVLALTLALAWVALVRVPLVLNARAHLDSDLAVDGLTLIDALNGRWRWHYPGTPFIGSPPVLLSWVQAKVWGPTPSALVSGGVVAYGLIVAGTFFLNRRAFGPSVAIWGLVPLAFASTGVIWLSGRVTGGHLLAAAWHAWAFVLFWDALTKGGWRRSAALGLWCGFGLYVDSMFALTWVGMGAARLAWVFSADRRPTVTRSIACLLAFALGSGVGVAPRIIGQRVDPHDAYVGQFEPVLRADHLAHNNRILLLDCLPRLISGHRLPGLEAEPDPAKLEGGSAGSIPKKEAPLLGLAVSVVSLGLFGWAMVVLAIGGATSSGSSKVAGVAKLPPTPTLPRKGGGSQKKPSPLAGEGWGGGTLDTGTTLEQLGPARLAIRVGLLTSTLAVLAGFLVYPSISDSDHYRYLVFLLAPWSAGFGLMLARVASKGRKGPWTAGALALGFALLMTVDSVRWYARLGWIDSAALPVRKPVEEPVLNWLDDHLKVSTILGDYWDVYKLSFLTYGRVRAVPFPQYPNRFPEIGRGLSEASHPVVIVRPGRFGPYYRNRAMAAGGVELSRARGLSIVQWPKGMAP